MCRLAAFCGAPISPAELVFDPVHSLYEQSWAPRLMTSGTVNADGFGVAWIDAGSAVRYARDVPIWQDGDARALLDTVRSGTFIAVVRSATPGIPIASGAQPMVEAGAAFAFNGAILPWRPGAMRTLHATLDDEAYAGLQGTSDTEALFRLLRQSAGRGSICAQLPTFAAEVRAHLAALGCTARLVMVAAEDGRLSAVRTALDRSVPTLFYRPGESGCTIASEPLDDSTDWRAVPEHAALVVSNGSPRIDALPD